MLGLGSIENEKKRAREEGKAEPAALLLYLFRLESEALQNKASALLKNIYLFFKNLSTWLGVRCPQISQSWRDGGHISRNDSQLSPGS